MTNENSLTALLQQTTELETFLHSFIGGLIKRKPKQGEDVTHHAKELGLKIPEILAGSPITWGSGSEAGSAGEQSERSLILVQPGNPTALGLTIGCIHVRNVQICLECGWIWCRIVIKGRF